jgi:hypothetical protein
MKHLAAALLKAKAAMPPLVKNANNPHFKSRYATLDAVIDAARPSFDAHGIAVLEYTERTVSLETVQALRLVHTESGETLDSAIPLIVKDPSNPQQVGSAITYCRRYLWTSAAGLAPEDDDGNAAAHTIPPKAPAKPAAQAAPVDTSKHTQIDQSASKAAWKASAERLSHTLESIGMTTKEARLEWVKRNGWDDLAKITDLNAADLDALHLKAQAEADAMAHAASEPLPF